MRKVHLADGCFNFSREKKCIYEIIIILVNYISMLSHLHTRKVGQAPLKEKSYICIIQMCWKWLKRNCERNLMHAGKHLAFTVVF